MVVVLFLVVIVLIVLLLVLGSVGPSKNGPKKSASAMRSPINMYGGIPGSKNEKRK